MGIKVAIVMPTLNNLAGGYEALESIRGTDKIFWSPIILDNWRENRILAKSWNDGILRSKEMNADLVLVLNDDILFAPGTLQGLVDGWRNKPGHVVMVTGQNVRGNCETPIDIFNYECPLNNEAIYNYNPDFACFMTSPDILEIVGKFDENFAPAYFEDNDYHRRIKLLGFDAASINWAPYYHYGSITQNYDQNNPVVVPPAFEANRFYYNNKWGGEPGKETFNVPYNNYVLTPKDWLPNMR